MGARYGQHFLKDPRAIDAILDRFAPSRIDRLVEIGPGRGALSGPLCARGGAYAAVEIDPVLARDLARRLDALMVEGAPAGVPHVAAERSMVPRGARYIVRADALDVRYEDLAVLLGAGAEGRLRVIGNLPYGVATALIRRLVGERHLVDDALVMVQKEVADRLLAGPGCKAYGIMSVLLALVAEREHVLTVGRGAFTPSPKVLSSVVALRFRRPLAGFESVDAQLLALLKIAFAERRKKIAANLARGYGIPRPEVVARLVACGIDPDDRAEAIDPHTLARLAPLMASHPAPRTS